MVASIPSGNHWSYGMPIVAIGSNTSDISTQRYWAYGMPTIWLIPSGGAVTPTGGTINIYMINGAFVSICYPA